MSALLLGAKVYHVYMNKVIRKREQREWVQINILNNYCPANMKVPSFPNARVNHYGSGIQ